MPTILFTQKHSSLSCKHVAATPLSATLLYSTLLYSRLLCYSPLLYPPLLCSTLLFKSPYIGSWKTKKNMIFFTGKAESKQWLYFFKCRKCLGKWCNWKPCIFMNAQHPNKSCILIYWWCPAFNEPIFWENTSPQKTMVTIQMWEFTQHWEVIFKWAYHDHQLCFTLVTWQAAMSTNQTCKCMELVKCIPVQFTVESYVSSGPIMNKYEQLWLLVGLRCPQGIGDVHVISQSSHSLGSAPVALRANSDTPGTAPHKEVLGIALNIWWTHVTPHCGI